MLSVGDRAHIACQGGEPCEVVAIEPGRVALIIAVKDTDAPAGRSPATRSS